MLAADTKAGGVPIAPAFSNRLHAVWQEIVNPVKPFLEQVANRLAEQVQAFDSEIAPYARYALTNQGKQLRPVLVALSGGAAGKLNDSLVKVAVIIEMVHLATLVHDDILDEAVLRRRRPTLAANWGNQISVLLGDCLFAHALQLAASFPTPEICRAVASATSTVCSGEILQTHQRGNFEFTRAEYFKVIEMKTAELFSLSCDLGAGLGGASSAGRAALRNFGLAMGTAYQVYDDCLDLFGREAIVGKSLGTDLANAKLTLPILVVLERGTASDLAKLRECVQQWDPGLLPSVVEILERNDARNISCGIIDQFLDMARQSLKPVADSPSRSGLLSLTQFLAQQTDLLGVSD